MRARPALVTALLCAGAAFAMAGCGHQNTPATPVSSARTTPEAVNARAQLAALAAAAKDRRYIAGYALAKSPQRSQALLVTIATDRTWRVDIQAGALGGTADIALVSRPDGQYQCVLNAAAASSPGCVKIAAAGHKISAAVDPLVQYPFTTWLDVLTDPSVAVTVTVTTSLPNVSGTCFAVEPTTVTLAPPIQSSVICFGKDGTMTGARSSWGTLVISGTPVAAPATVTLPGAIVSRAPLQTAAPPAPSVPASVPSGLPVSPKVPPTR